MKVVYQKVSMLCRILVAWWMCTGLACAEQVKDLDLHEFIKEALQHSPGILAKKKEYEAARANVKGSWLPEDPLVGVSLEGREKLFRTSSREDTVYMFSQTTAFPTKLALKAKIAGREAQKTYYAYKEKERDVIWHIEQPYYELHKVKRNLAILQEHGQLLKQILAAAQARYAANKATQEEVLSVQMLIAKNDIAIIEMEAAEHVAEAHFSHILSAPLLTRYVLADRVVSEPFGYALEELEELALQARPELQRAMVDIDRARAKKTLDQSEWLPDITGKIEARSFRGDDDVREYDTFVGVSVPVWSLLKGVSGGWQAAAWDVEAVQQLALELKNEVLLKIHEAYSQMKAAEYARDVYRHTILPQAKQRMDVLLASYAAGQTEFSLLLEAQKEWKDGQMAYETYVAQYEMKLSDLRLAVGDDLSIRKGESL